MAKIKFYFDSRRVASGKEVPLKVAVTQKSRNAYITLNIRLMPTQWDEAGCKVVSHPQRKSLNDSIKKKMIELQAALLRLEEKGIVDDMSATEIRDALMTTTEPNKMSRNAQDENSFSRTFERFITHKSGRTKGLYECTMRRIRAFEGAKADRLRFEQMNGEWLQSFNDFLALTSPSPNARAIHLRNIRTVFNYAIDNEITTAYPFRRFKIKGEATKKRNLDVDTLRAIFTAENLEPWMVRYRDLFKLTFMLIGINFVDLCNLQEVRNGRVEYVRAKTHKLYSIKVEPETAKLIAQYRGDKNLLSYLDSYKDYRSFYMNTCKGLRAVKEAVNKRLDEPIKTLTTYYARHSWATIAASLDIPKDTIAAALGHGGNTVTDIYIEFDRRKVDEANRRVLNYVLYGYDGGYLPDEAPRKRSI